MFVTCGYVPTEQYKEKLEKALEVWYPDEGEYLGMFLCQGRVESDRRKIMISQMPSKEKEMQQMFRLDQTGDGSLSQSRGGNEA